MRFLVDQPQTRMFAVRHFQKSKKMKIERQLQATLNTVFTELIKERQLEKQFSPYTTAEENRADITLKDSKGKPIFFIELKDPTAKDGKTVFDSDILLREIQRAEKMEVKYFGVCNFTALTLIDKNRISDKVAFSDGYFTPAELNRLRENFNPSGAEIQRKLRNIANFYLDKALEITQTKTFKGDPIDEIFIFKIRKLIQAYAYDITDKVFEKYQKDKTFEKKITEYVQKQQWNKPQEYDEIENLTYIALLMLISKLIFYKTYQDAIYGSALPKMSIDENVRTAKKLQPIIQNYLTDFQEVTGDFELLIGEKTDVIYQMPFESDAVVDLVKAVVKAGNTYNFAKTPYDVIGRIFEELIREDERHKLGQYFTPSVVIDLINAFCIRKATDKVLDPSCGSGTFLVRAYERKKEMGVKQHDRLLLDIYGSDISNYAVYLAMLNLSIRNMRQSSYPRILHRDFFSLKTDQKEQFLMEKGEFDIRLIPKFDAVVGNPPYTRQEDINTFNDKAKEQIYNILAKEWKLTPSRRTSIYAYFFYYAAAFLKENGYLGFIVSNSWLDTDFGTDLQTFFLTHFEIHAIIESSVERFFPSAEVNTNIVILKRQSDPEKRAKNVVKFVYLHQKLAPITEHYGSSDQLRTMIESTKQNTENQYFTINCVEQNRLSTNSTGDFSRPNNLNLKAPPLSVSHGRPTLKSSVRHGQRGSTTDFSPLETENERTKVRSTGKWSLFLKAPKVYWQIMEKGKNKFVPLNKICRIKRGITTGANDFFIFETRKDWREVEIKAIVNNLKNYKSLAEIRKAKVEIVQNGSNELWLIESKFLAPIFVSPKDSSTYELNEAEIEHKILIISTEPKELKKYPFVQSYLLHGEKNQINERSTCAGRNLWYDLGEPEIPTLAVNRLANDVVRFYRNDLVLSSDNFSNVYLEKNAQNIWLYLNSTVSWLFQQLVMVTNYGAGVARMATYELEEFPVLETNLEKLDIDLGETRNYKQELGTGKDLKEVNPERLKLDHEVLKALGFSNKTEREEVLKDLYQAVINLISKRLEKSKSVKTVANNRQKVGISAYVENLRNWISENGLKAQANIKFAKKLQPALSEITADVKLQQKILSAYWKEQFLETFDWAKIEAKEQKKLF